jgi:hypothetical protein
MTQSQTRRKLLQDMQLRGFSEGTISCYSIQCDCFLGFCKVRDTAKLTEKYYRYQEELSHFPQKVAF